jgi:hypothetical protein
MALFKVVPPMELVVKSAAFNAPVWVIVPVDVNERF